MGPVDVQGRTVGPLSGHEDAGPLQSTTWRALAAAGCHVFNRALWPGALVSQHRYPPSAGSQEGSEPVPFETRLGLVISVYGTDLDAQVNVMWSSWSPSAEPAALAAGRRVRRAARAHSA